MKIKKQPPLAPALAPNSFATGLDLQALWNRLTEENTGRVKTCSNGVKFITLTPTVILRNHHGQLDIRRKANL